MTQAVLNLNSICQNLLLAATWRAAWGGFIYRPAWWIRPNTANWAAFHCRSPRGAGGESRPGIRALDPQPGKHSLCVDQHPGWQAPAATRLTVSLDSGQEITSETNDYGLAEIHFTPQSNYLSLQIAAEGVNGAFTSQSYTFSVQALSESVLLRTDRPVYQVGDSMTLDIFTTVSSGRVYLDIIRSGQTVSTRSLQLQGGRATAVIDLTPDLTGTLNRTPIASSMVEPLCGIPGWWWWYREADGLLVNLSAGQETYKPGDMAALNLQVNGLDGSGCNLRLGWQLWMRVSLHWPSRTRALQGCTSCWRPKFLPPRYDIQPLSLPNLVTGLVTNQPQLRDWVTAVARASLAVAPVSSFSLSANSHEDAIRKAFQLQKNAYTTLLAVFSILFLAISVVIIWKSVAAVRRDHILGRSILVTLAGTVGADDWLFPGFGGQQSAAMVDVLQVFPE